MIPDNYFLTYLLHIYFISWRLKKIIRRKWKISRFLVVCESHYTINVTTCFTWNYPPKISIAKISSKAHHFKDKFWSCFRELYFFPKKFINHHATKLIFLNFHHSRKKLVFGWSSHHLSDINNIKNDSIYPSNIDGNALFARNKAINTIHDSCIISKKFKAKH